MALVNQRSLGQHRAMLEHLFGSKTRVKLLSLFLRNPQEAIFVRELARRVGTQINAVRRELANLSKLGLLEEIEEKPAEGTKATGAKKKYYQVNQNFPLIPELSSLMVKSQVMLERQLDKRLLELGDVRYLAFMGTFLGSAASAPLDIFIVSDNLQKDEFARVVGEAEESLGIELRYTSMTTDEFRYRKDITDRFLYAILEAKKNVIVDKLQER